MHPIFVRIAVPLQIVVILIIDLLGRYTREFRYNIRLATPVIFGMLGHTLVALIDNIMVGQLGSAELAAVSLGNSFMFVAMSLGIGFCTAISLLLADVDASEDRE